MHGNDFDNHAHICKLLFFEPFFKAAIADGKEGELLVPFTLEVTEVVASYRHASSAVRSLVPKAKPKAKAKAAAVPAM